MGELMALHQAARDGTVICAQEKNIEALALSMQRMERGQERVIELLEKVANQDARITHLEHEQEETKGNFNEVFERVRGLELSVATTGPDGIRGMISKVEAAARLVDICTSRPAIVAGTTMLALIVSGAIMDIIEHGEKFAAMWKLITGG